MPPNVMCMILSLSTTQRARESAPDAAHDRRRE